MIFDPKKDNLFSIIFYGSFAVLLVALIFVFQQSASYNKWISLMVIIPGFILLIWIWYGTKYSINNTILNIESGPFKKNIPIRTIKKLEIGKTMWVGYKLGLSRGGIIIHYNQYDEIYITPVNATKFCKELKRIHSQIEIAKN